MKMVIGLGNPEDSYLKTRHNTGFIVLDEIISSNNLTWDSSEKLKAWVCVVDDIVYVKPSTYMNKSGEATVRAKDYYGVDLADLIVIHDDVDLEFGRVKEQVGAGSAGHKGVESIFSSLGTKEFKRLRVGIGRPLPDSMLPVDEYVLKDFTDDELEGIKKLTPEIEEKIGVLPTKKI